MIAINYRDPRPIYEQIQAELRRLMLTGALPPGSRLPSVRELAGQLAINPNTIQRAYRELESEGYILSVAGKGSFVAQVDRLAEQQKKEALNAFRAAAQRLRALGLSAEALASLLTHVTKTFGGATRALDDLTLTVPQGAVYGLVGSNGAGKTTAIRHITGIFRQDSGSVTIGGLPVYENPAVKSRIGYIPDDLGVFGGGTLRELAAFYRTMYPRFDAKRYAALRDVFRLGEATPLRRFSKGMQKHAAFWLTLSLRPDYLVLDEPVDGLDPVMRRQIWSLVVEDVAGYGTTVLVSSHNLREREDVCDHVGIMNGGKVLLEHPLTELQANIVKVLVALPDEAKLPDGLDILHQSSQGHLYTLIVHGDAAEVTNRLSTAQPQYLDVVPLTLEEIFIYELGGADYAVKDILL